MPIYEYQCTECGKTFEIFQKMSDEPLTRVQGMQGKAYQAYIQLRISFERDRLVRN